MTSVVEALPVETDQDQFTQEQNYAEDRALVQATLAGDSESFGALYVKHVGSIKNQLFRLSGNPQITEDLAQDTFVKAFKGLDQLTLGERGIAPWLHTIARNTFLDHTRKGGSVEVNVTDELPETGHVRPAESLENRAITDLDLAAFTTQALKTISADFAKVLLLIDGYGFTYQEAADVLGVKVGTIRTQLHRGRKQVAQRTTAPEGYGDTPNQVD